MYLLVPFLPLLACLQGSYRRSVMLIALSSVIVTLAFIEIVLLGSAVTLKLQLTGHLWYWFMSSGLSVEWCLLFDGLTVSMLIAIMSVSLLVQLYSLSYMSEDPHFSRFYGYLSLFTFAMTLLVTADNLIMLFMGWEFVGIASYLLINFWFTRLNANIAALKAFLLNRVGDWALALGLLLILLLYYDFSTAAIFGLASYINEDLLLLISLFLIIGASAKSALVLLGLHLWLPNAMEGPTPVSALIHAATMVTAGIYLFLRMSPLFECCETALLLITWLGGVGSILGAIAGLLINDMKKVIAYSTISQLGYMTVSCGSSQYSVALFHLINHAFFKALLFLSAGAIIHAFKDEQDMRKMGSFGLLLPWTYSFVLLGIESMMAFPFLTGFYSKDFLLELALVPKNTTISVAYIFSMLAAILTATYSTRILILGLIGQPNFALHLILIPSNTNNSFNRNVQSSATHDTPQKEDLTLFAHSNAVSNRFKVKEHEEQHESDFWVPMKFLLWLPLTMLSIGAAISGFIAHELFLSNAYPLVNSLGSFLPLLTVVNTDLHHLYLSHLSSYDDHEIVTISFTSMLSLLRGEPLIQLFTWLMIFTALPIHKCNVKYNSKVKISISNHLTHWNNYNGHHVIKNCQTFSLMVSRYWDRGLVELIAPLGLLRLFHYSTFKLELLSTGFLPHYSFALLSITILAVLLSIY